MHRATQGCGEGQPIERVMDLDFTDDIALLDKSQEDRQTSHESSRTRNRKHGNQTTEINLVETTIIAVGQFKDSVGEKDLKRQTALGVCVMLFGNENDIPTRIAKTMRFLKVLE